MTLVGRRMDKGPIMPRLVIEGFPKGSSTPIQCSNDVIIINKTVVAKREYR
jgi:hypothetical protein